MPKNLELNDHGYWQRPGTKDWRVFAEILEQQVYRNTRIGFDVEAGENWLDLGGHIGVFGIYALNRGAESVVSYEPCVSNFNVLVRNAGRQENWITKRASVSHLPHVAVPLFGSGNKVEGEYPNTKYTLLESTRYRDIGSVPNYQFTQKFTKKFDCIKMDIEGSELGILDQITEKGFGFSKSVRKLVMEYHFTKDKSFKHFQDRIQKLRSFFPNIYYIPSIDRLIKEGHEEYPGMYDRFVYAWR